MAKKTPMTDSELAALLGAQERQAIGYYTSEIAGEQAQAIDYYYGQPFGDERAGRSKVVDHVVAEVIDNALAALLKPFVSSDEVVSFQPRGPEDEEQAQQATEYVNYVFQNDNDGFLILHDWFKAALLEKLATVKIWWEDKSGPKKASHRHISATDVEDLIAKAEAGEITELEITQVADEDNDAFDATFMEEYEDGCIRVECVPSEEFLISPLARNADEAPYIAHRTRKPRSTLIEMGFDGEVIDGLPKYGQDITDDPRSMSRYRDEDWGSGPSLTTDKSQDLIEICHEFPLLDFDGDGIAERRVVIRAGNVVLFNDVADDHPFALLCPVPMPHKVYGLSLADQTMDLQRISSVLSRQMLDNLYLHNNPRPVVAESAERDDGTTLQDLQVSDPGAIIRTRMGGLDTFMVPFVGDKVLAALEWTDQQQEARTGISRQGQGIDKNTLKKQQTATESAIEDNRRNERVEMIARIFAETGVKQLFRKMLALMVKHQPRERVVRMRNKWVAIDPRGWDAEMDMAIAVGLGVGNKQEQAASMAQVLEVSQQVAMSPYAGLVTEKNVYNQIKKLFNALGLRNTDDYLTEPQEGEQKPPPPPSPEQMKAQADMQAQQAKLQLEQQSAAAQMDFQRQKAAIDTQLAQEQAAQRLEMEREKATAELALAQQKAQAEYELAIRQQDFEFELAKRNADHTEEMGKAKIANNRPGGDLDK